MLGLFVVPESPNPHDALFRYAFSNPEDAASLLKSQLPARLVAGMEWDALEVVPGSFVDEVLRERHTDLLFTAPLGDHTVLVYLLLEHQSSSDPWMPLRLVQYQLRIWDRWRADNPHADRLPLILPVVVHHGARPWSAPTAFEDLLALPHDLRDELQPSLLSQRFVLDDLTSVTDEALARRALTAFANLTLRALARMRHLGPSEAMSEIWRWLGLARRIARAPTGLHKLRALLHYLVVVADVPRNDLSDFDRALAAPDLETVMPTLAERLRDEGREEARTEMLLRMLRLKFPDLPDEAAQRVEGATPAEIERWSERMLFADNLDEIFAD